MRTASLVGFMFNYLLSELRLSVNFFCHRVKPQLFQRSANESSFYSFLDLPERSRGLSFKSITDLPQDRLTSLPSSCERVERSTISCNLDDIFCAINLSVVTGTSSCPSPELRGFRQDGNVNTTSLSRHDHLSYVKTESVTSLHWKILFTYITEQQTHSYTEIWLSGKTREHSIPGGHTNCSGWIKANVDRLGLYRVNYQVSKWAALSDQLATDHAVFSCNDRKSILDDAFSLA
ncbi:hypothetical protein RRG08_011546 [Elysia crispata]|uniref:ERAP1-like C-terminal domain-containing protein n=1 Tax=Elysia crispata TaxID=231223 RepID=A0AAE0ZTG6_9GAST|nr:hypothetical protein RRG08_011546 [Elysia crispata]